MHAIIETLGAESAARQLAQAKDKLIKAEIDYWLKRTDWTVDEIRERIARVSYYSETENVIVEVWQIDGCKLITFYPYQYQERSDTDGIHLMISIPHKTHQR